jgi:hypothetical protein
MEMELHDDFWYPDFTWQDVYVNANATANNQSGFLSVGCMGNRLLQNSDFNFRALKYGDSFNFEAGYKIFQYDNDIVLQSSGLPQANNTGFFYFIVDSALNAQTFASMPQVNATATFPAFRSFVESMIGKQEWKSSNPVNFTVAPMNNATNAGMTASITLAKTAD